MVRGWAGKEAATWNSRVVCFIKYFLYETLQNAMGAGGGSLRPKPNSICEVLNRLSYMFIVRRLVYPYFSLFFIISCPAPDFSFSWIKWSLWSVKYCSGYHSQYQDCDPCWSLPCKSRVGWFLLSGLGPESWKEKLLHFVLHETWSQVSWFHSLLDEGPYWAIRFCRSKKGNPGEGIVAQRVKQLSCCLGHLHPL